MFFDKLDSPLGPILIAADEEGLRFVHFENGTSPSPRQNGWRPSPEKMAVYRTQLDEYFQGKRTQFSVPLAPQGTAFQKAVWEQLLTVPFGTTASYGDIARRVNKAEASRAVGAANGKNPIPIIIPCHRIIGANGKLTGYAGGVEIKQRLLAHEKVASFLR